MLCNCCYSNTIEHFWSFRQKQSTIELESIVSFRCGHVQMFNDNDNNNDEDEDDDGQKIIDTLMKDLLI